MQHQLSKCPEAYLQTVNGAVVPNCSAVRGGAYAHAAISCYTLSSFLVLFLHSEQMMSQPAGQAFGGTVCINTSGGCTVHNQIHGYKMEQLI